MMEVRVACCDVGIGGVILYCCRFWATQPTSNAMVALKLYGWQDSFGLLRLLEGGHFPYVNNDNAETPVNTFKPDVAKPSRASFSRCFQYN